jgi:hypothetical protein
MNDNTVEFEGVMRNGMLWKRVDGDRIVDGFAPDGDYHVTLRRSELKLKPLKPCPNLHEDAPSIPCIIERGDGYEVACTCGWVGPWRPTKADAIAAWNRRA